MHQSQGASLLDDDLAGGPSASVDGGLSLVAHRSVATGDGWIERDNEASVAQQVLDALARRQAGIPLPTLLRTRLRGRFLSKQSVTSPSQKKEQYVYLRMC